MGPYEKPEDYLSMAPPPKQESAPSGGASSFLSSVLGSIPIIGNIASAFLTNKWNRDAVEERNRMAIEQWNRENAYNHPLAQMMRLKSAGLNPNLIYGNGASSMLAAKSPDFQSSHYDPVSVDPLTAAQIRNLDAQSREIDSRVPINEKQVQYIEQTTKHVSASIDNIVSNTKLLDAQAKNQAMQFATDLASFEARVKSIFFNAGIAEEDYGKRVMENLNYPRFINSTISHIEALINNLNVDSSVNAELKRKIQPEIDLLKKKKDLVKSQTRSIDIQNSISDDFSVIDKIFGYLTGAVGAAAPFMPQPVKTSRSISYVHRVE